MKFRFKCNYDTRNQGESTGGISFQLEWPNLCSYSVENKKAVMMFRVGCVRDSWMLVKGS